MGTDNIASFHFCTFSVRDSSPRKVLNEILIKLNSCYLIFFTFFPFDVFVNAKLRCIITCRLENIRFLFYWAKERNALQQAYPRKCDISDFLQQFETYLNGQNSRIGGCRLQETFDVIIILVIVMSWKYVPRHIISFDFFDKKKR